jgi:phage shock protein A
MGLFSRIADLFRSNVNDALDKAEDPEKMLKQMVLDMEESVNQTTVANAMANEKGLARRIEAERKNSQEWHEKAKLALQAGNEELAKAALEKKSIADRNVADLHPSVEQARQATATMREQLNALKRKLDEARARQSTLIARSQAAKAQKQLAQAAAGVGTDAFSKFDKFETKIEKLEAEASAFEQLASENTGLDEQFRQLTSTGQVDNDLLELKRQMGMLPEGKAEEPKP